MISNLQEDCHQDDLLFVCLQFYKHNCLNIFEDNICFHIQIKNQMTVKDSQSLSFSGTIKPQKLLKTLSPSVLILVFKHLSS